MTGASEGNGGSRTLLAVAAPKEVDAVLAGLGKPRGEGNSVQDWRPRRLDARFDLLITGVGKANAAAAMARACSLGGPWSRVINIGIVGALPGSELEVGAVVDADVAAYADEGSLDPAGFTDLASMGFGPLADICGPGSGADRMRIELAPLARIPGAVRGGVATVSTCSGVDALASEVARRTGCIVEDMELAALAFTLKRLSPATPCSAIKVVSNQTGDEARRSWDLPRSLKALTLAAAPLRAS
ncbi:MAG: futalosine hydrolase [Planctomycetota bacterium]|nr:futalosine hydrolase [Planctomycetota bacterium]